MYACADCLLYIKFYGGGGGGGGGGIFILKVTSWGFYVIDFASIYYDS